MADQKILNQPVVIDNGSGTIKPGFAGDEKPKSLFSNIVGRPKYSRVMASVSGETTNASSSALGSDNINANSVPGMGKGPSQERYIGSNAQANRGLLKLKYPMEHGVVNNWDDMELVWSYMLQNELFIHQTLDDHPILITEAALNPKSNRDKMCSIWFEVFNSPAMYITIPSILSLYSSGRTTGVVIDSGDGVTQIVPVYNGFALPSCIKRIDLGGRDLTHDLSLQLRRAIGLSLTTSSELEIVRNMKERCCYISKTKIDEDYGGLDYYYNTYKIDGSKDNSNSSQSNGDNQLVKYRLPDGKLISIGARERSITGEILFNPSLVGLEYDGVHDLLNNSILKADMDLRSALYQSIVLSGGNTTMSGFGDRLLTELKRMVDSKTTKLKIYATPDRKTSSFVGGSILASLSTFKKMWISRDDYHENPDLVNIKYL